MEKRFDAFIFDLDGTLLDTLPDLVMVTNRVLREAGYPERTDKEILGFVGDGLKPLLTLALPPTASETEVEALMGRWMRLYPENENLLTREYPGMTAALEGLARKGMKLAVLSNKYDGGVKQVIEQFFPGVFVAAHGEGGAIPRKPDPAGLLFVMEELQAQPATSAYVGDSPTDILTAHRSGAFAIGVTWGYHDGESLQAADADAVISHPQDLLVLA